MTERFDKMSIFLNCLFSIWFDISSGAWSEGMEGFLSHVLRLPIKKSYMLPLKKSPSSASHLVGAVFVHQCIPCTFFRTDYGCLEFFKCHTIITQHFLVYKFVMFYTRVLFAIMELILNWVLSQTKQAGRTIIHAQRVLSKGFKWCLDQTYQSWI